MNPFLIAIPVFAVTLIAANFLRERSFKYLDVPQAGSLVLNFRPNRLRSLAVVIATLAVFLALRFSVPAYTKLWFLLFLSTLWAGYITLYWVGWRKLKVSGFPTEFLRVYGTSMLVGMTGITTLFVAMAATQFMNF